MRRPVELLPKALVFLLAVIFVMVGAVAVDAATPAQVVQADKKAAVSAADQLLGGIVLPAGASRTPTEPTGDAHELAQPMAWFGFAAEVDRHEFWTVTSSPSAVIASFSAHLPAGAKPSGPAPPDPA